MNIFTKLKNAKYVQKFIITLSISLLIIIAGVVMTCVKGMNLGIEFTGGIKVSIDAPEDTPNVDNFDENDFENTVTEWLKGNRGEGNNPDGKEFIVKEVTVNKSNYVFILGTEMIESGHKVNMLTKQVSFEVNGNTKTGYVAERENNEITEKLNEYLSDYFNTKYGLDGITNSVKSNFVGNESAKWVLKSAIIAVAVAIAVILVYIAIRFTLLSGLAAILALIHNVLIMFALTSIFQISVNQTFIAAIVTIIGYSINSTIVVFDKIRELMKKPSYKEVTDVDIANEAIGATLKRTILTTLTTLVMIVLLAVFGTQAIKEFAYPIIFGLVAGAYSSILLAAPTWVYLRKLFKQADKKPVQKKKKAKNTDKPVVAENA